VTWTNDWSGRTWINQRIALITVIWHQIGWAIVDFIHILFDYCAAFRRKLVDSMAIRLYWYVAALLLLCMLAPAFFGVSTEYRKEGKLEGNRRKYEPSVSPNVAELAFQKGARASMLRG